MAKITSLAVLAEVASKSATPHRICRVPGALFILSTDGAFAGTIEMETEIRGPADFALDNANGTMWIPATLDNQVVVIRLSD
ncbi:hypothetical protein PZN02_000197 [Sinorhizobium garamanticum]|uniref:Uncharacterized protein n=1 Tax=Sinorhizobium garamanticum TaxID=680247 RepID=A0ABY8DA55_9HYPH|nr:hypothetical protein [Sinorhizobium garamanticum]WEX87768.1 hypothetical protein PZN02_000197 [Sinorhizobium garamanticum]